MSDVLQQFSSIIFNQVDYAQGALHATIYDIYNLMCLW